MRSLLRAALTFGLGIVTGIVLANVRLGRAKRRVAFVMELNGDEHLAEYKKRHDGTDEFWVGPRGHLKRALQQAGVANYSIHYYPETKQLFAYAEVASTSAFSEVSKSLDCALWWKYFEDAKLMRYNDNRGTTLLGGATPWSAPLEQGARHGRVAPTTAHFSADSDNRHDNAVFYMA